MTIIAQDDFDGAAGPLLGRVAPVGGAWTNSTNWPPPLFALDGAGSISQTNPDEGVSSATLPVQFIGPTGYIEIVFTPTATTLGGVIIIYVRGGDRVHEMWLLVTASGVVSRRLIRNSLDSSDSSAGSGVYEETLPLALGVPCTVRMEQRTEDITLYVNGVVNAVRADPLYTSPIAGQYFEIYMESDAKLDSITVFDGGAVAGPEHLSFWSNLVGVTQA